MHHVKLFKIHDLQFVNAYVLVESFVLFDPQCMWRGCDGGEGRAGWRLTCVRLMGQIRVYRYMPRPVKREGERARRGGKEREREGGSEGRKEGGRMVRRVRERSRRGGGGSMVRRRRRWGRERGRVDERTDEEKIEKIIVKPRREKQRKKKKKKRVAREAKMTRMGEKVQHSTAVKQSEVK